jgi:hypothetical protein
MLHLEEPSPILGNPRYQKLHTLGKGSFGSVLLARDGKTSEVAAIKSIRRAEVNKYVEGEIMNHSLLRHPHVIQFKEVFLTRDHVCIVMEYATGGSLFHYVQRHGRLKEPVARWFFQQLVLGVDYCHKKVRGARRGALGGPAAPLPAGRRAAAQAAACSGAWRRARSPQHTGPAPAPRARAGRRQPGHQAGEHAAAGGGDAAAAAGQDLRLWLQQGRLQVGGQEQGGWVRVGVCECVRGC